MLSCISSILNVGRLIRSTESILNGKNSGLLDGPTTVGGSKWNRLIKPDNVKPPPGVDIKDVLIVVGLPVITFEIQLSRKSASEMESVV